MISNWAIQTILDQNLKNTAPGLPVYLRTKNSVEDTSEYVEFGFQFTATGGGGGVTDTLIEPPPSVTPASLHNIGLNAARLQFGAHTFDISHTFVLAQMALKSFTDPYQVWRDPSVIGLIYNNRLFSMESIFPEIAGGSPVRWLVTGNQLENAVPIT